jgi:prepilin-type N-terminal cleavage/methylation domain-containing protein
VARWFAAVERARHRDSGFTLIEMMTATALLAVLGGILVLALHTTVRAQKAGDDESSGLGDVRAAIEQLSRDIRDARAVTCDGGSTSMGDPDPTCASHLQLWIDYNSNYLIDPSTEIVDWELTRAADGSHYEVIRSINDVARKVARSLIVQVAFSYDTPPTNVSTSPTRSVTTFMTYDTLIGLGTKSRNLTFTTRLRNVA